MSDADLPATYISELDGRLLPHQRVFDPALRHRASAFRTGEPLWEEPGAGWAWRAARREVSLRALAAIGESDLRRTLMLRGSWPLALWYGDRARDPNDLDFVALTPATRDVVIPSITKLLRTTSAFEEIRLRADELAVADIWTYERAEGRRIVVPWVAERQRGLLQIDVTFNELLAEEPTTVRLPESRGHLLCASKAQSLAWKLMWLITDLAAQGKDLYDAVLLAEDVRLSDELKHWVVSQITAPKRDFRGHLESIEIAEPEWEWFVTEYPDLAATADQATLRSRLTARVVR